ncbi:hypothetical protein [Bradyrhizobium sp. AUGA SZCCT0283]|uniref:hypothetical protein n=1 Tax=Bradyrhizobium sp. AUGA SZCCT0283 TaxID=2807671 RepID=UPI001BA5CDF1|nr:hypothetical protein [Bradyrhizobium sp. AUGA SZCCT0283]MBR1277464.1 hypothetical protein [Bradyrhizobium sp. AUGA SZCCT0283]
MTTASEAKLQIVARLAAIGMTLRYVVEWNLFADDEDSPSTAFVYFSWHGGSDLVCFDWPWGPETFDAEAYERFFSNKATVHH